MEAQEIKTLIDTAVAEATKAFIAAQPSVNAAGVQVTKDAGDQPFESDGKFFQAVKNAGLPNPSYDPRLAAIKAPTGLNEAVGSQGGFLVPPQVAAGIISNMNGVGTLLSLFKRIPVEGNSMTWNVVDETSRADGSRMGGVRGYWLNEAGTKTSSKPLFRQLELKLRKVAALCYATDEVLEDASALGSWLQLEVPNELRFMVEDAMVNGDGVGKPLGILSGGALVSATREDASEIAAVDIGSMWARRYTGANDYVWLVNPGTFPQLLTMSIGNQPMYIGPGGFNGLTYGTLLGRPVIETEYNPALGTLGDIILVSPSQYYMIEKAGGVQTASSIHVNFIYDETAFRFVYRVDGAPLWYTTLTGNDTVTRSPYVVLAATT